MVIVHLSDNQRRIISPSQNETLEQLFSRFCVEFGYPKDEYKFQNPAPDEHVLLDMSIHANRVKDVSLVHLCAGDRKGSRDSTYTVIHDVTPRVTPKRPPGPVPSVPSLELKASVKPAKRSAPKPPIIIPQPVDHIDESISPDIDIPPPPEFLPASPKNRDNGQASQFYKSTECGTEKPDGRMETSVESSSSCDVLETPESRDNISDIGNSLDSTEDSEDWHKRTEDISKEITSLDKLNVPCASQESLGSSNIDRDVDRRSRSSNCSSVSDDDFHDNGKRLQLRKPSSDLHQDSQKHCHDDKMKTDRDSNCSPNVLMEKRLECKLAAEPGENERKVKEKHEIKIEKKHEKPVEEKHETKIEEKHEKPVEEKHETQIEEKHEKPVEEKHEELNQGAISNASICQANKEKEQQIDTENGVADKHEVRNSQSKPETTTKAETKTTEEREESRNPDRSNDQSEECSNNLEDSNESDSVDGLPLAQSQNPAAKQHWELPKEGKTMQFLSRTLNTIEVPEEKIIEKQNEPEPSDPVVKPVKSVQVTVQEVIVEQSDRPTYRPRQTKKLYFTAG